MEEPIVRLTRTVGGALSAGALAGSLFMAAPASALQIVPQPAPDAGEFCRAADEGGFLFGVTTRGECVNILKGPSSDNSISFIAGICGSDLFQSLSGTTNKGECIKAVMSFSSNPR